MKLLVICDTVFRLLLLHALNDPSLLLFSPFNVASYVFLFMGNFLPNC